MSLDKPDEDNDTPGLAAVAMGCGYVAAMLLLIAVTLAGCTDLPLKDLVDRITPPCEESIGPEIGRKCK